MLAAWYPGTSGGEAIANILFGRVNPSGRLPITFPASESQLPRKNLAEQDAQGAKVATYAEGAKVGYKWFEANKLTAAVPVRLRIELHRRSRTATSRRTRTRTAWW